MHQSAVLMPLVGASCFMNLSSNVSSPVLPFCCLSSKKSVIIFRELYFGRYKFLMRLLNGMCYNYRHSVAALKSIIHSNVVCFCLQTPEMYLKLNIRPIQF